MVGAASESSAEREACSRISSETAFSRIRCAIFAARAMTLLCWPEDCSNEKEKMQPIVKGMVQVHSVTYRIVRVRTGQYDVVRLLDDVCVGTFSLGTRREAIVEGDAPDVIREVARAALQGGRTTWAPRRLSA